MKEPLFLSLFRSYIEYYRNPPIIDDLKSPLTLKGYIAKYNNVLNFLEYKGLVQIKCKDWTIQLANELVTYIKRDTGHNYAVRCADLCKAVLTWGFYRGLVKENKLALLRLKKKKPAPPTFLNPEEVSKLESYDLSRNKKVVDMFLFQCYTGLDFGDLMSLSPDDFYQNPIDGRMYIVKARKKTGIEANIPLLPEALKILSIYPSGFQVISNQKYNYFLKDIARHLCINKRLTSHIGRKTFAMNKLNYERYGMEPISKMLGHASVKTTETYYARVNLSLISNELDRLGK